MNLRIINTSCHPLTYATDGSIGLDLRSAEVVRVSIRPRHRALFVTGIRVELPDGHGAFVEPRSGLSLTHGVLAATGVIDTDYRGEIGVVLYNLGHKTYTVKPGDRIAQLVIFPVAKPTIVEVEELSASGRGANGWGSSGR